MSDLDDISCIIRAESGCDYVSGDKAAVAVLAWLARGEGGPPAWQFIVHEFARRILHGDKEHQAWLLDAAEAFTRGNPMPPPRDNNGPLRSDGDSEQ